MAEPSGSNYPSSLDDATSLLGAVVTQEYVSVSGEHTAAATTITCTATITNLNAPGYLVNGFTGEIIHYGGISGADLTTCTRGADGGASAVIIASGAKLYAIYTSKLHNQLRAAVIAVETELGVAPSGSYADVATRLSDMAQKQITLIFDGGGAAIVPLTKLGFPWRRPTTFTMTGWNVLEMDTDASDSLRIGFSVWHDDDTNFPPTLADNMEGAGSTDVTTDDWKIWLNGANNKTSAATLVWETPTWTTSDVIYVVAHGYCDSLLFTGAGLDDAKIGGKTCFDTTGDKNYLIEIQTAGTPDIFHWTDTITDTTAWNTSDLSITDTDILIDNNIWIRWAATTGHSAGDKWNIGAVTIEDATKVAVTLVGTESS